MAQTYYSKVVQDLRDLLEGAEFVNVEPWDEISDPPYKSTYLGSFMSLDPCGKYHHILSPNNPTEKCEKFWDYLNRAAENKGGWIEVGEGDPTEIYYCEPGHVEELRENPNIYSFWVALGLDEGYFFEDRDKVHCRHGNYIGLCPYCEEDMNYMYVGPEIRQNLVLENGELGVFQKAYSLRSVPALRKFERTIHEVGGEICYTIEHYRTWGRRPKDYTGLAVCVGRVDYSGNFYPFFHPEF